MSNGLWMCLYMVEKNADARFSNRLREFHLVLTHLGKLEWTTQQVLGFSFHTCRMESGLLHPDLNYNILKKIISV